MIKIISDIHNAVQNSRKTVEFLLENSRRVWVAEYPIALLHKADRVEDTQTLETLGEIAFFDGAGFSKNNYTHKEIAYLIANAPNAIKCAYLICMREKQQSDFMFFEKHPHDKWKKIHDEGNFEAFVASSKFEESHTSKEIETALRDIMRSTKEIPSLRAIGFIWIATLPNSSKIEDILNHYFLDNHIYVQKGRKISFIAWSQKLANINMRHFVNTP